MTTKNEPLDHVVAMYHDVNEAENLSPMTVRWYDECLRAFIDWLIEQDEEPTLASVSVDVVAEYVLHLQTRPNRHTGAPLSPRTVHAHVRALKALAGHLYERGDTETNVLQRLKRPKVRAPEIDVLSEDEMLRVLSAAQTSGRCAFRVRQRPGPSRWLRDLHDERRRQRPDEPDQQPNTRRESQLAAASAHAHQHSDAQPHASATRRYGTIRTSAWHRWRRLIRPLAMPSSWLSQRPWVHVGPRARPVEGPRACPATPSHLRCLALGQSPTTRNCA